MANDFVRNIKGVRNINNLSRNITTENDLISTNDNEVYVVTNGGYRKITGVETKEIKQLKTDVSNVKIQSDSNTLNISDNTDDIETNTTNIGTLQTDVSNNTSEIETLKTSTGNNTSEIETLKTSTDNNTSDIDSTQTLIEQLQTQLDDLKSNTKQYYTLFEGSVNGLDSEINLNDSYKNYSSIKIHIKGLGGDEIKEYETIDNSNIVIYTMNVTDSDGNDGDINETHITKTSEKVLTISNQVAWRFKTQAGQEVTKGITITKIEGVK